MRLFLCVLALCVVGGCSSSTPVDGGASDAGMRDDASVGSCVRHIFCADFDGVAAVEEGWTRGRNFSGGCGTPILELGDGLSPPHALYARTNALPPTSGSCTLYVLKEFNPSEWSSSVDVSFALAIDEAGVGYVEVMQLLLGNVDNIRLRAGEGELVITEAPIGGTLSERRLGPYVVGSWLRFSLHIDLAAQTIDVTVDDALVLDDWSVPVPTTTAQFTRLILGAQTVGGAGAFIVRIDDVTFDAR